MSFLRPATQIARTQLRSTNARTFTRFTPTLKADTTPSTQGHATQKAKDPIHKDKDIQSSAVRGGKQNKEEAQSNPSKNGEEQPFDAARQGNTGGELKTNSAAGTGAFMDQVGGQGAGGAQEGEKVDAAGESYTDMAKNVLTGNFGKGAKVCLNQPGDAAKYGRILLTYRNHSTHPLDPMSNHHPMQALNQGSPNTKLNLNPIKVPTSSTRTPKSQIREKAMPLLNPTYLRSREIRRGDMLLGPQEATPRLSNQKVPTNMYVFPPSLFEVSR